MSDNLTIESEDENLLQRPRPYQIELFQHALKRNIVAYLDTGSGKTLVSVLLIQELVEDLLQVSTTELVHLINRKHPAETVPTDHQHTANPDVKHGDPIRQHLSRPLTEITPGVFLPTQPKKVIFLVPTVPLVAQQAEKIRQSTDLAVGEYSREDIVSVTYWDAAGWYHEISKRQVLVLTPQIFLNILRHGFMNLSRDVSLLVIDECHHAVKQHPYNVLLQEFYHTIPNSQPRPKVFGMTASPIYQKTTTRSELLDRLQELQDNLNCVVMTVADRTGIHQYIARASELLVEYHEPHDQLVAQTIEAGRNSATPSMQYYMHYLHRLNCYSTELENGGQSDAAEKLRKNIAQVETMKHELGFWVAARAAEELTTAILTSRNRGVLAGGRPKPRGSLLHRTAVIKGGLSAPQLSDVTEKDVTPKLLTLLRVLEERAKSASTEEGEKADFRAMIFVERRLAAKVLCEFINLAAPGRFPVIKCSYVTGHGGSNNGGSTATGRNAMSSAYQKKAFDRFRKGLVNTLVVTRVAEEGVDIPACRLIVVFDMFRSHTGYVQSRGRARDLGGSEYIIMVQRNDMHALRTVARAKVAETMTRTVAQEMAEGMPANAERTSLFASADTNQVLRSEYDNDTTELLLGSHERPLVSKAGATISSSGALQLLQRYWSAVSKDASHSLLSSFAVAFDHRTGTLEEWQKYLSQHLDWTGHENSPNAKDIAKIPYGFAFSFCFPSSTPLAGEIVFGPIRATKKLAQHSAALEACRRLYLVGGLNEHLLPNVDFKAKPGAFSLPRLLGRHPVPKGNVGIGSIRRPDSKLYLGTDEGEASLPTVDDDDNESVLCEYEKTIPRVFQNDEAWRDILSVGADEPSLADHAANVLLNHTDVAQFFVTVLALGPEFEVMTRGMGHSNDVFDKVLRTPECGTSPPSYRRTVAILTRRPLPASVIPKFGIWLGDEDVCPVQVFSWNCDGKHASEAGGDTGEDEGRSMEDFLDDEDEDVPHKPVLNTSSKPVSFTREQVNALLRFQKRFWDFVLRRPPPKPLSSGDATILGKRKRLEDTSEPDSVASINSSASAQAAPSALTGIEDSTRSGTADPQRYLTDAASQPTSDDDFSEKRMYMILPMFGFAESSQPGYTGTAHGISWDFPLDPTQYHWIPDWEMVRRVVEDKPCNLYDWLTNTADMASSLQGAADASTLVPSVRNLGEPLSTGISENMDHPLSFSQNWGFIKLVSENINNSSEAKEVNTAIARQGDELRPGFDLLYKLSCCNKPTPPNASSEKGQKTRQYPEETMTSINHILSQTVAFTRRNNIAYFLRRLVPSMQPITAEFKKFKQNEPITYKSYVERMGYSVPHEESAMVEGRHTTSLRNVLKPPTIPKKLKSTRPSTSTVFLVPDTCEIVPFPMEMYRLAMLFPSILHKLEIYCTVDQFRCDIGLPYAQTSTLFTAFAAPSAQDSTNYERLETLGDSFLKYAVSVDLYKRLPAANEGVLTKHRSRIVSNRNLFEAALKKDLGAFLNVTPFNPKWWAPPGSTPLLSVKRWQTRSSHHADENDEPGLYSSKKGNGWRLISRKMLADFVEALIGAYYTDGGNDVAMHLLHKFGLVSEAVLPAAFGGDKDMKDSRHHEADIIEDMKDGEDSMEDATQPTKSADIGFISVSNARADYHALEQTFRYRFNDRTLLLQALTHPSCASTMTHSYQRLEFLGDAVLDWVLTRFFFNSYPHLSPAALTELRVAAVNNESFARMAVSLGLNEFLRHDSPALQEEISIYLHYLQTLEEGAHPIDAAHEGPKVLGDIFEAIAGAVFIDSGCDLLVMWMVFKPLMTNFLDLHANPDVVSKSPIRQLHEFFQKKGFAVNDVSYRYGYEDGKHSCELFILDRMIGHGEANTRQLSKRLAVFEGLEWIRTREQDIDSLLKFKSDFM